MATKMSPRMVDALRHGTLEEVKSAARRKKAAAERACDACGAAIPAGSRYMLASVPVRAYRSAADIGHTHGDVRLCNACCPVTL